MVSFGFTACANEAVRRDAARDDAMDLFVPPTCTPGALAACACTDGDGASQVCLAGGTFGVCGCRGVSCSGRSPVACTCSDGGPGARTCWVGGTHAVCSCSRDAGPIDAGCVARSCASLGVACGTLSDGCGRIVSCGGSCNAVTIVPLDVRHIVYDASHDSLLASTFPSGPNYPSSIVLLDPSSGAVRSTLNLGAGPDSLVLSDDDAVLWASLVTDRTVRMLDLASGTPSPAVPVPPVNGAPASATALALPPGSRTALLYVATSATGCALGRFDTGASIGACPSSLVAPTADHPYGASAGTPSSLLVVSTAGPSLSMTLPFNAESYASTDLVAASGRPYSNTGPIYDLIDPANPTLFGYVPLAGSVAIDVSNGLLYVVGPSGALGTNAVVWRVLDLDSLTDVLHDGTSYPIASRGHVQEMIQVGRGASPRSYRRTDRAHPTSCTCFGRRSPPQFLRTRAQASSLSTSASRTHVEQGPHWRSEV